MVPISEVLVEIRKLKAKDYSRSRKFDAAASIEDGGKRSFARSVVDDRHRRRKLHLLLQVTTSTQPAGLMVSQWNKWTMAFSEPSHHIDVMSVVLERIGGNEIANPILCTCGMRLSLLRVHSFDHIVAICCRLWSWSVFTSSIHVIKRRTYVFSAISFSDLPFCAKWHIHWI